MATPINATPFIWVGYAAGTLTTICFVPQLLHVWRTKRADDLHIGALRQLHGGNHPLADLWPRHPAGSGDPLQRRDADAAVRHPLPKSAVCAGGQGRGTVEAVRSTFLEGRTCEERTIMLIPQ